MSGINDAIYYELRLGKQRFTLAFELTWASFRKEIDMDDSLCLWYSVES